MSQQAQDRQEEEVRRIIRLVKGNKALAEELRRALLDDELLELPEKFAKFATAAIGHFGSLHQATGVLKDDVKVLKDDVKVLKDDVKVLKDDVGEIKGDILEDRVRMRPDDYLYDFIEAGTSLTRAEVIGLSRNGTNGLSLLTTKEAKDLKDADLVIVGGHDPETRARLSAVVEVSVRAGRSDIERARRRADILALHGHRTVAIVVARHHLDQRWLELASESDVHVVVVGAQVAA